MLWCLAKLCSLALVVRGCELGGRMAERGLTGSRVAVVGSGISGLSSAWLLHRWGGWVLSSACLRCECVVCRPQERGPRHPL